MWLDSEKRNEQGDQSSEAIEMRKLIFQDLIPLVFAAMLIAVSACAQGPTPPATSGNTTAALQPYLGKWRPTSFSEQQHIGSLTISESGLSIEVGDASVRYELERNTSEGVILRVTGRKPANAFPKVTFLAFFTEMQTVDSFPPGGPTKTRVLLWICYWSGSLDQLASGIKKAQCGNTYTR